MDHDVRGQGGTGCRVVGQRPAFGLHSFKDRAGQLNEIREVLDDPTVRVVSLLGRRGIGKSLLAVRAATAAASGVWPDGARTRPLDVLVYLGQRTTGITFERLFFDCLEALGEEEAARLHRVWASGRPAGDRASVLFDSLAASRVMLLLDNLEDALGEDGRFAEADMREWLGALLAHESPPKVLLTSQSPLRLDVGQRRAERRLVLAEGLPEAEAVELLREMDPEGAGGIRGADHAVLAETVRRLHGVPRGLELVAAAVLDDVTMPTLSEWLGRTTDLADVVDQLAHRQYGLLDGQARLLVDVLGVFGVPVPLDALVWVLGPVAPDLPIREVVGRLVHGYLVRTDRRTRTYALHPMDADIARADLARRAPDLAARLHRRVADWYARTAGPAESWLGPLDLTPHRREMEHRVAAGDLDEAALVLDGFSDFLLRQGSVATVLAAHETLGDRFATDEARLAARLSLGHARLVAGPMPEAARLLAEACDLAEGLGDGYRLLRARFALGDVHRQEGRLEEAVRDLSRAVGLAEEQGLADEHSHALLALSLAHSYSGRPGEGLRTAGRLNRLAQETGLALVRARAGDAVACALSARGDWPRAVRAARGALDAYREAGVPEALGFVWNTLGLACLGTGEAGAALEAFERGLAAGAESEIPRAVGMCAFNRAWALWSTGRADEAEEAARAAVAAFARFASKDEHAAEALRLALAAHRAGDPVGAAASLRRTAELAAGNPDLVPAAWLAVLPGSGG